jgi:hypothetical protein
LLIGSLLIGSLVIGSLPHWSLPLRSSFRSVEDELDEGAGRNACGAFAEVVAVFVAPEGGGDV